jgi:hypothetical protein
MFSGPGIDGSFAGLGPSAFDWAIDFIMYFVFMLDLELGRAQ